jgi:predicted nicotinamide N-methyase
MTLRLRTQNLELAGHRFTFQLPADQDEMLEHALAGEQSGTSDWDPYWGLLWAAAPKTAELILGAAWPKGLKAIELGCGIGLTGLAAVTAGMDVTFADHSSAAVSMALNNVLLNDLPPAKGLTFDWNQPPNEVFDFAFASDVLYDIRGHQPLITTLNQILAKGGTAWIGDAGRINAPHFVTLARSQGWDVTIVNDQFQAAIQPEHMCFRLMIMKRQQSV